LYQLPLVGTPIEREEEEASMVLLLKKANRKSSIHGVPTKGS
jgi:hypothetical protein